MTRPPLQYRSTYTSNAAQDQFMVPLLNEKIEQALNVYGALKGPNPKALDIGCGGQPFRNKIESMGFKYFGLDNRQNIDVQCDLIADFDQPFAPAIKNAGPFQLILCTEVLEHILDWRVAFSNLREVTVQGSRVVITCPFFFMLHEAPFDYWRPTIFALKQFAANNNFKVLQAESAGNAWDVLGTLIGATRPIAANKRWKAKLAAKVARQVRKLTLTFLRSRWLQKLVDPNTDIYLANIVVLEKI